MGSRSGILQAPACLSEPDKLPWPQPTRNKIENLWIGMHIVCDWGLYRIWVVCTNATIALWGSLCWIWIEQTWLCRSLASQNNKKAQVARKMCSAKTYNYQGCSQPAKHTVDIGQSQRPFLFPPFTRAHASSCHLLIVKGQPFKTHVVMQPIIGDASRDTIVLQRYNISLSISECQRFVLFICS